MCELHNIKSLWELDKILDAYGPESVEWSRRTVKSNRKEIEKLKELDDLHVVGSRAIQEEGRIYLRNPMSKVQVAK